MGVICGDLMMDGMLSQGFTFDGLIGTILIFLISPFLQPTIIEKKFAANQNTSNSASSDFVIPTIF